MKTILWITAILLLGAIAPLPIGYYTFLRMVVTIASILVIIYYYKAEQTQWIIVFGFIALVFNPLIPVYLHSRNVWIPINIICGLVFIHQALKYNTERLKDNRE